MFHNFFFRKRNCMFYINFFLPYLVQDIPNWTIALKWEVSNHKECFHVKSSKALSSLLSCQHLKIHILNLWNYNRFCIFFLQGNKWTFFFPDLGFKIKILLWGKVFILETHIKFYKCPFNLDHVILTLKLQQVPT